MTLTNDQLRTLFNQSGAEMQRFGFTKTCAIGSWVNNVHPQWLYRLALEVASVKSMPDADILPTVFGAEWFPAVKSVCRSDYYYWRIVGQWALLQLLGNSLNLVSAEEAIAKIRSDNSRLRLNKHKALSGSMTLEEVCEFTHAGIILWDADTEQIIINPMWFAPDELSKTVLLSAQAIAVENGPYIFDGGYQRLPPSSDLVPVDKVSCNAMVKQNQEDNDNV